MSERTARASDFFRANGIGIAGALLIVALGVGAARWVAAQGKATAPHKVQQFTVVKVLPERVNRPPPPPRPTPPVSQKEIEQPRSTRVELKSTDLVAPPSNPTPGPAAGGGRLSLAAEGEGPGDAFNLVGNPGGRGILSGGGLGDGSGDGSGDGLGRDGPAARFGWYYAKVATEVEEAFRRIKQLNTSSARFELRIWIDPTGRITRTEPVRADVAPELREALQSVVGLQMSEPPPAEIPMPMVARLTARRPR